MGFVSFLKKVRDSMRVRVGCRVLSKGPLASSSVAGAPSVAAPLQIMSTAAGPDPLLPMSDATESCLAVSRIASVQEVASFVSEDVRIPSPSPKSKFSVIYPPFLTSESFSAREQEAGRSSQLNTDSEDSSLVSIDSMKTSSFVTAYTVHCYIPPEIAYEIIAFLDPYYDSDRVTLCSCALVCKDWLPASRRRLFRHVNLWKSHTSYDLFVSQVLRREDMQPWLALVQELTLGENDSRGRDKYMIADSATGRGYRLVHEFSGRFPNLRHLEFCNVSWSGCPAHRSAYLAYFRQLRALRVLILYKCHFSSFYAFWRTVSALPSLGDLAVDGAHWPSPRTGSPTFSQALPPWPKLHTLELFFGPGAEALGYTLFSCLSQTPPQSSIRRLVCEARYYTRNPSFFHAVATSVTDVFVLGIVDADDFLREDTLSCFSQLVSLSLVDVPGTGWARLAAMLQNVPSRLGQLTVVVRLPGSITVGSGGNHGIDDKGLELLDAVVARDNFKNLELVHFDISMSNADNLDKKLGKSMISEAWKKKLPKLTSRGLMELGITLY